MMVAKTGGVAEMERSEQIGDTFWREGSVTGLTDDRLEGRWGIVK